MVTSTTVTTQARHLIDELNARDIRGEHGHSPAGNPSPTYQSWYAMQTRCKTRPKYVVRGIKVCERWLKFENFLKDMGVRPEGHTLERENNNGHYEPGNCKWATPKEQANNTSRTVRLVVYGAAKTMREWAAIAGEPWSRIHGRHYRGWADKEAVFGRAAC